MGARCQLKPMHKAALTINTRRWGILNTIVLKQSNGHAEGMSSKVPGELFDETYVSPACFSGLSTKNPPQRGRRD